MLLEYFKALAWYLQQTFLCFKEMLRVERKKMSNFCVGKDIDPRPMGTLLAIAELLRGFYGTMNCERSAVLLLGNEDLAEELGVLVSRIGAGYFGGDFAAQFCSLAQQGIRDGWFHLCDAERAADDSGRPIVYRIGTDLGFSREAYRLVCSRMRQSGSVVAHALAQANVLRGKLTNPTTYQTRISVCNVYGITRTVPVYRIGELDLEML